MSNSCNCIEQLVLPDDVRKFNVTISIPENYPLDFYYLMDLSNSMGDDLQTIQDLSPSISQCEVARVHIIM